jgi:prepilin-type processing-associated H-X9-DG protein
LQIAELPIIMQRHPGPVPHSSQGNWLFAGGR